ncbi:3702_t:CDS:2, partial [Ambispora leptoticha]
LIKKSVELEKKYALDACPKGIVGINAEQFSEYVEHKLVVKQEKKDKEPANLEEKIQRLLNELSSLKSELDGNDGISVAQKSQLEKKQSNLEIQIKNLSSQEKQNKSTIEKLEKEVEKLKKRFENDKKPDKVPEPDNKKEEIVNYKYPLIGEKVGYYVFDNISSNRDRKLFYINQNHPQIKKLLSQEKLQENKQFAIRYGKIDKESSGKVVLTFNEDNQELEIIEV